jgi:hypothetical protein
MEIEEVGGSMIMIKIESELEIAKKKVELSQ